LSPRGEVIPWGEIICSLLAVHTTTRRRVLTGHSVSAVVAHEVDGGVDHVEGDVDAGVVLDLDAVTGRLEKAFYARPRVSDRVAEKNNLKK
jgi:hypothetical protein